MSKGVKRVLIYRVGSLGDTVVALPALHLVARAFVGAERRMLTNFPVAGKAPPAAAVLEGTSLVHGYFRYAVGTRSVVELVRLCWALRRWRADVLVYLAPARGVAAARRDARFFKLCGIRRLVGVPVTEAMQANCAKADGVLEFEAERLARCVAELGDARLSEAASWELRLSAAERARAEEVLAPVAGRPVMAVSVGTKVETNDWGPENWTGLMGRLAALYPDCALAVAGAASDAEYSEGLAEVWRAGGGVAVNLCGQLSPRESAAVFARAAVYVGHDSGPMHLAAAVGTPCVGIFSARGLPRVWFPYGAGHRVIYHEVECAGCGLAVCVEQRKKCLTSVSVEEVLAAVREVLEPRLASVRVR